MWKGLHLMPKPGTMIFGVPTRKPFDSEMRFFEENPNIAGMASRDNKVLLNPYSTHLSQDEINAVSRNEAARVHMRKGTLARPKFGLTKKQKEAFSVYGSEQDQKETIIGRIISGDPSALDATKEQRSYADRLLKAMSKKP